MAQKPVIFLAFANDRKNQGQFLKALEPEKVGIKKALIPFQKKFNGIVYDVPSSEPSKLLHDLNQFIGELSIFHFSGHANGTELSLEMQSGEVEQLAQQNLAHILADEKKLVLVFLNACSTFGQIQTLQKKGTPAIIATNQAISDHEAAIFATSFYESLMAGSSLEQAFLRAKTILEPSASDDRIFRGFKREIKPKKLNPNEFPWGLYLLEQEISAWKLIDAFPPTKPLISRSAYILMSILYLLFASMTWFWAAKPTHGFGVDITARTDRVGFDYISGPDLFQSIDLKEVSIQQFETAHIPGDFLTLDSEPDEKDYLLEGGLKLEALPGIEETYLYVKKVSLQGLSFPDSSKILLTMNESLDIQVDIFSPKQVESRYYASDTLELDTRPSPVQVLGAKELDPKQFEGISGKIYPVEQEFHVLGQAENSSYFLQLEDSAALTAYNYKIKDPEFIKRDNLKRVSSIITADIMFSEAGKEYSNLIYLQKGDDLVLDLLKDIQIASIAFEKEEIVIRLTGEVENLYAGPDASLHNPTRMAWWWGNRKGRVIFLGILFIGLLSLFSENFIQKLMRLTVNIRKKTKKQN